MRCISFVRIKYENLELLLKRFSEFAQSHTGHVTLEEFSALLGLDITDDVAEKTKASVIAAFDEDKHLLEIMQRQIGEDPRGMDYLEVTLGADGAGIFVRQILNKQLAAEGRPLERN